MEACSSSSSPSFKYQAYQELPPSSFHSALRTVRKSPAKPCKRQMIAPMPPNPPRIYKVDPINFMDLVQKLTGAAAAPPPQRLQSVALPPLNVSDQQFQPLPANTSPLSMFQSELMSEINSDSLSNPETYLY